MTSKLVDAVRLGRHEMDWMTVVGKVDGSHVEFRVSADAIKVDGIRESCTPKDLEAVCEALGALAPVPALLDLRFLQAAIQNDPQPKYYRGGRGMSTGQAIKEHSHRVDVSIAEHKGGGGSVGNVGKHWCWPLEVEALYGWHVLTAAASWRGIPLYPCELRGVPQLKVIQRRSKAHTGADPKRVEGTHSDYSMSALVVAACCRVTAPGGCPVRTETRELLGVPAERWGLVEAA